MRISFLLSLAGALPLATEAVTHKWDTVRDVMAMHGKYSAKTVPTDLDIQFVANTYGYITTGTGCSDDINATAGHTIEDSVLATAARIKKINPDVKIGMYYRSDMALEISECSQFTEEWLAHPEYRLKDDEGNYVQKDKKTYYIDYGNPDAAAFFVKVLVNVTKPTTPSGKPLLDYVYIDGDPNENDLTQYKHGIGPERSAKLVADTYAAFGEIQRRLTTAGHGQFAQLNGVDSDWEAAAHVATGAFASMFDHWSILQFLDKTNGDFNQTMMEGAFELVNNKSYANHSFFIKGWPGPIIRQRDQYPPNIPTPTTPEELAAETAKRFNNELALFLLKASEKDFWIYSWFWGWYDYIPGNPESSVPADFFPEANCAIGEPLGVATQVAGTQTYTREFEHASVFVDLSNRTNCKVTFKSCYL